MAFGVDGMIQLAESRWIRREDILAVRCDRDGDAHMLIRGIVDEVDLTEAEFLDFRRAFGFADIGFAPDTPIEERIKAARAG